MSKVRRPETVSVSLYTHLVPQTNDTLRSNIVANLDGRRSIRDRGTRQPKNCKNNSREKSVFRKNLDLMKQVAQPKTTRECKD